MAEIFFKKFPNASGICEEPERWQSVELSWFSFSKGKTDQAEETIWKRTEYDRAKCSARIHKLNPRSDSES